MFTKIPARPVLKKKLKIARLHAKFALSYSSLSVALVSKIFRRRNHINHHGGRWRTAGWSLLVYSTPDRSRNGFDERHQTTVDALSSPSICNLLLHHGIVTHRSASMQRASFSSANLTSFVHSATQTFVICLLVLTASSTAREIELGISM